MGQSRPLFVYFRPFLITISIIKIEKSIDGVLGIRNHSHRMVGADKMELWWPPKRPSILSDLFITLLNEIWRYLHYIFFSSVLHLLQCFLIWHLSLPPLSPTFLMKISPHCATPLFVSLGSWHTRINGDKKYKLLLYKIA